MKILLSICIVLMFSIGGWAQQEAQFSQYYNNPYFFNPAAGGLTKTINIDVGYRRQWLGLEGTPQSFYVTGHSEISLNDRDKVLNEFNVDRENIFKSPKKSIGITKHVVGGRMMSDQIGPFQKTSVMGSYAYHLRFSKKTMLSLGMSAGWSSLGIRSDRVVLLDQDDAEYNKFLANNSNQNLFDINAGIALYGERFQAGVSSTQLLKNELVIDEVVTQSQLGRHWFAYGMYKFPIPTTDLAIEPHFMAQIVGKAPVSFNLGARVIYQRRFWANIAYRFNDALNFAAGMNVGQRFRIGYAYDSPMGAVQQATNYVHELQLGMVIGNNRNIEKELQDEEKM